MVPLLSQDEVEEYKNKIIELRIAHRDLDDAIGRLAEDILVDQLELRRLKKRKLQLKDLITRLESKLIPDLDA